MKKNKSILWKICKWLALAIMVLAFTNVVIPADTFAPTLGGFPYTLWVGILVSIVLVILTFLATKLHPESKSDEV